MSTGAVIRITGGAVLALVSVGWAAFLLSIRPPPYGPTFHGRMAAFEVWVWEWLAWITLPIALALLLAGGWLMRAGYRRARRGPLPATGEPAGPGAAPDRRGA